MLCVLYHYMVPWNVAKNEVFFLGGGYARSHKRRRRGQSVFAPAHKFQAIVIFGQAGVIITWYNVQRSSRHIITAQRNNMYPETVEAISIVLEGYINKLLLRLCFTECHRRLLTLTLTVQ